MMPEPARAAANTRHLSLPEGDAPAAPSQTGPLDQVRPWVIEFRVVGTPSVVQTRVGDAMMIGRCDTINGNAPEVDLAPFDAFTKGVSRKHALITVKNQRLMLRDLNSTNGTRLNNMICAPGEEYRLRHGDELLLGQLKLQVSFAVVPSLTDTQRNAIPKQEVQAAIQALAEQKAAVDAALKQGESDKPQTGILASPEAKADHKPSPEAVEAAVKRLLQVAQVEPAAPTSEAKAAAVKESKDEKLTQEAPQTTSARVTNAAPKPATRANGAGKRVLVIEDDPDIAGVFRSALEISGYKVTVVNDVTKALGAVFQGMPDAIILDLMLPDLNGLDLVRYVRKQKTERHVPVLVISDAVAGYQRGQAISAGADEFLGKPVVVDELVKALAKVMAINA